MVGNNSANAIAFIYPAIKRIIMEIYLIITVAITTFALRLKWVMYIHRKHDKQKSDYQFYTNDNSIDSRDSKLKYLDYVRILAWREQDFIKKEYKLKIEKWKKN